IPSLRPIPRRFVWHPSGAKELLRVEVRRKRKERPAVRAPPALHRRRLPRVHRRARQPWLSGEECRPILNACSGAPNHTWTGPCSATTLTTLAHVATIQESRHSDSSTRLLAGSRLPSSPHPVVIACEGRPCSTPGRGSLAAPPPPRI